MLKKATASWSLVTASLPGQKPMNLHPNCWMGKKYFFALNFSKSKKDDNIFKNACKCYFDFTGQCWISNDNFKLKNKVITLIIWFSALWIMCNFSIYDSLNWLCDLWSITFENLSFSYFLSETPFAWNSCKTIFLS